LDRRPDRWERIQGSPGFKSFPHVERWSGTDGKKIDIATDPRISVLARHNIAMKTRRGHEFLDTVGAVGCYLSHASVYEWFAKSNDQVILIFEDDVALPAGCYERLKEYVARTPLLQNSNKWDMWMLGPNIAESSRVPSAGDTQDIKSFVLAHAYFVSKRGVEKLLKNIYPIEMHVDGYMSYMAKLGELKIYGPSTPLFMQSGSASDIHPGHGCAICDIPTNFMGSYELIESSLLRRERLVSRVVGVCGLGVACYYIYRRVSG
jgi:GR25 family glycosyltransferase involved in LPS biosynthesis